MNDDDEIKNFLKGAKKNLISVIYRRRREKRREERAKKKKKKKKKKTVVVVVSLSLPSSLPFFGRRTFWTTKERERTLIEILTPHD